MDENAGTRERLFAAHLYLIRGRSISDAMELAVYDPYRDTVDGVRVKTEGAESLANIRGIFPRLFPSDQSVLDLITQETS